MDTIKKIANAILDAGEGCQSGLVYVDPVEAAKAAIAVLSAEECSYNAGFNDGWEAANGEPPEAALSAGAEPVAWGNFKDDGTLVGLAEEKNENWIGAKPLYVTPPAPSVAVKALEWDGNDYTGWSAYGLGLGYQIDDESSDEECFILEKHEGSSVLKSAHASLAAAQEFAQADYETRIRCALSAQVQDVAGWQSMDSAPKDGKHCLLAVKSDCFVYAVQGAFMMGEWHNAADIKSEPLCWMPLTRIPQVLLPWADEFAAAAPAPKQEQNP